MSSYRKKLIEVALPLDAINRESAREKSIRHGHPSTLHLWWARRPLAACRAVIFASLVDDPEQEGVPQELLDAIDALPSPPQGAADAAGSLRRAKLFRLIEELVLWENTTNEPLFETARSIIRAATGGNPPPLLDPFCGGGSIPLEAQRLGLEAYASDLNPVAVLITKALVEIPPKFAGRPPVNPEYRARALRLSKGTSDETWKGAAGLAADVRYYGKWMRDRAWERIGHLYPKAMLPSPSGRGDGGEGTVIAWLWARTVKCPNPACGAQMPLVRSFWLSTKKGKEAWVEPIVDRRTQSVRFEIKSVGKPEIEGTMNRTGTICLTCGTPSSLDHVRVEAQAGRMDKLLMAMVGEGNRSRVYLSGSNEHVQTSAAAQPNWHPVGELQGKCRVSVPLYGMNTFADLFTPRQLVALTTFCDLVGEARALALKHSGGDAEYANAVVTYLACAVSRLTDYHATLCTWNLTNENVRNVFVRQALPMVWDFAEANPLHGKLDFETAAEWVADALKSIGFSSSKSATYQLDATQSLPNAAVLPLICTDPPYYDNIGYADLTDFFYVWLRRCLANTYPELFSTVLTPKQPELIAAPYRFDGDRSQADTHFETGMAKAFLLMKKKANPNYPIAVYYAFKQEEEEFSDPKGVSVSTGWEKMLNGMVGAGYQIVGTWPMRTTKAARAIARNTNALASAIVLACRPRPEDAPIATRREFLAALRRELPEALRVLMGGHVAPVDLAQAAIGPGMAVFSRYSRVLEADGSPMTVRTALQEINFVIDDYLAQQEGDLDVESQFCVAWFEHYGAQSGPYGEADVLARAKNVSVDGLARLGLVESARGRVRLTLRDGYGEGPRGEPFDFAQDRPFDFAQDRPFDFAQDRPAEPWDPRSQPRLTVWEACQRLVWTLKGHGEKGTGPLARRLGGLAERARELAYRLYSIADRKGWAEEALGYNALGASWPEIQRQAVASAQETQGRIV